VLWPCCAAGAADPAMRVVVVDAPVRVAPDNVNIEGTDGAELSCARREAESFQIVVVNQGPEPLRGIDLACSAMDGESRGATPRPTLLAYREHYVRIDKLTPKTPGKPGLYPDALIPFIDPYTGRPPEGGQYRAAGFLVPPGVCQAYWVDVVVPPGTPAGAYQGRVTVKADGAEQVVTVRLTVWDFELPRKQSLKTWFGVVSAAMAEAHGLRLGSPRWSEWVDRYLRMFDEHRIATWFPTAIRGRPDGHADITPTYLADLREYVDRYEPATFYVLVYAGWPFKDGLGADVDKLSVYLGDIDAMLARNPWIPPAYVLLVDEPHTPEGYEAVRRVGRVLHGGRMRMRNLVPFGWPVPIPDDLTDSVDTWVMVWKLWDDERFAALRKAGKEVWSYTALISGNRPVPFWHLEAPPFWYAVPFWTTWSLQLDGFLYWSVVAVGKEGDPWRNPAIWTDGKVVVNGEGCLMYPGHAAGVDGPVPSIRLKIVRDGLECYEYLKMLADRGGKAEADAVARSLSPSFFQWDPDYRSYASARRRVAQGILARGEGSQ